MIITTVAGNGTTTYTGDGPATAAGVYYPQGVAVDDRGNIYFSDGVIERIRMVNPSGIISLVAGNGTHAYSGDGTPATDAGILNPDGVNLDISGNIFIAEEGSLRVRLINTSGIITTIAGPGLGPCCGPTGDGGPATAAQINYLTDVAPDTHGNFYIAGATFKVRKVNSVGIISTFAGTGTNGYSGDGRAATLAQLNVPEGVTVDDSDNLYIADTRNHCIRKVNTAGIITTIAGTGGTAGFGGDGGPATAALLNSPNDMAVDGIGNVYIPDYLNNRIRMVNTAGIITTIAGTGSAGFSGDNCAATGATMNHPYRIAVDRQGNVYFSDRNNNRIRKLRRNAQPRFAGGHSQGITLCLGAGADTINTLLAVNDSDLSQGETWSVVLGPMHGTLVATCTATSTGSIITPTGLYYTPTVGYTGNDSFRVQVQDCGGVADTTTVYVTVVSSVSSVSITGSLNACPGTISGLGSSLGGGTWSSGSTGIATIGSLTGLVTGVAVGTATISYSLSTGCGSASSSVVVTVNPLPAGITGTGAVCAGTATTLSEITMGGTWSSGAIAVATVGSAGSPTIVTGVAAGTAIVYYTLSTGCAATYPVTVNPLPAAIGGAGAVCAGAVTTLSEATAGGTWSSGSAGIATIGSLTGVATGITTGTSVISYTLGTGCASSATVTVNTMPAAITGTMNVCTGAATALSNSVAGGAWSSGSSSVATAGSAGVVTGVAAGTAGITYTLATGCAASATVTVYPAPAPITGLTGICEGATSALSDAVSGGTWSCSAAGVATIGSASGIVTGVAPGATIVTYNTGGSCMVSIPVSVYTMPTPVSGIMAICTGNTTTLSSSPAGGVWGSGSPGIATAGTTTGIVTGAGAGVATIAYTLGICIVTAPVTVNTTPAAIGGAGAICVGATTTLSDPTAGGTWSSSDGGIAAVDLLTGTVGGASAGTATITYTGAASALPACYAVKIFTVVPTPGIITGTPYMCAGDINYFHDPIAGGIWSSSNAAVATAASVTGMVTALSGGAVAIIYTLGGTAGCTASYTTIINPGAGAITGSTGVCVGLTTALADGVPGGSWSSIATLVATVNSSGIVTGVAPGTALITYTLPTGCGASVTVTVNSSSGVITGTQAVCAGGTTALSNPTAPGGTWSSSATGIATIGTATGIVRGLTSGTTTITYSLGAGCTATADVTVNPLPSAITGTATVCVGATTTLSDGGGGTWANTSTAVATVGSTGIVSGVSAGTSAITYTLPTGCTATKTVTVNPLPVAGSITGASSVCAGATIPLTESESGGAWSGSGAATVGPTGVVRGVSAGTATISYSVTNGCGTAVATKTITVNPLPIAGTISGAGNVCAGAMITLSESVTGGVWSPAVGSVATVGSAGTVTSVSAGTATISYSVANGCGTAVATKAVTINPLPEAISGPSAVCVGATIAETDLLTGGTWLSSSPSIATIIPTGAGSSVMGGVAIGLTEITYTLPTTCAITKTVTVSLSPTSISGAGSVCAGAATNLTDAVSGGSWMSSNTSVATIGSSSGTVTGLIAGTTTITYSLGTGCTVTKTMTVNAVPAAITGVMNVCERAATTLSDITTGGVWMSSSPATATIGSTGVVSGVTAGVDTIVYSRSGCSAVAVVTVNPAPGAIGGVRSVCAGATTVLSNGVSGGAWNPAVGGIATVSATGMVTGVAAGTATITYTLGGSTGSPSACTATAVVTVNPLPDAGTITGAATVCVGDHIALSDPAIGGAWSASNSHAIVLTGNVTGISSGTDTISYRVTNSCGTDIATKIIAINSIASAGTITGASNVCVGATITLTDPAGGGTWSPAVGSIAAINPAGEVRGVAVGSATITYTVTYSCGTATATKSITVNPLPVSGTITGTGTVCVGNNIILSDGAGGGVWGASNGSATVVSGIVTGASAGVDTITYAVTNSCGTATASKTITVNAAPVTGVISGPSNVCAGAVITLTSSVPGGAWSRTGLVSIVMGSALCDVSGIAAGAAIITYTVSDVCGTATITKAIVVNPLPAPITGTMSVCKGATTTLSDPAVGGTWSSGAMGVATVSSGGIVTGVAGGGATISYTLGTGCATTATVTVNTVPAIIGVSQLCAYGDTTRQYDSLSGGAWSSTLATVSGSGLVTAYGAGVAIITYTSITTTCFATKAITVNPLPGPITGTVHFCISTPVLLSDASPGGIWTATGSATISGAGVVTGTGGGTATISYTFPATGCSQLTIVTVDPVPNAGAISGAGGVCAGAAITLSETVSGGAWSGSGGAATVVSTGSPATATVTGIAAGMETISYTYTNLCGSAVAETIITVNALPDAGNITGAGTVCAGANVSLTETVTGGVWSVAGSGVITVTTTGTVNGIAQGEDTVIYTVSNMCGNDKTDFVIAVNTIPPQGTINGQNSVCIGMADTLTGTPQGGVWTAENGTATVSSAGSSSGGIVTGVSAGANNISYSLSNECGTAVAAYGITVYACDSAAGTTSPQPSPKEREVLRIWPNPNDGAFTVLLTSGVNEVVRVVVTNVTGQQVGAYSIPTNKATEIKLAKAAGVYFLSATARGRTYVTKLVIAL